MNDPRTHQELLDENAMIREKLQRYTNPTGGLSRAREAIAPLPSFIRGIQVGAFAVGAVNTAVPGQFGVVDWPLWLRLLIAFLFLAIAVNHVLCQRGNMLVSKVSR